MLNSIERKTLQNSLEKVQPKMVNNTGNCEFLQQVFNKLKINKALLRLK